MLEIWLKLKKASILGVLDTVAEECTHIPKPIYGCVRWWKLATDKPVLTLSMEDASLALWSISHSHPSSLHKIVPMTGLHLSTKFYCIMCSRCVYRVTVSNLILKRFAIKNKSPSLQVEIMVAFITWGIIAAMCSLYTLWIQFVQNRPPLNFKQFRD